MEFDKQVKTQKTRQGELVYLQKIMKLLITDYKILQMYRTNFTEVVMVNGNPHEEDQQNRLKIILNFVRDKVVYDRDFFAGQKWDSKKDFKKLPASFKKLLLSLYKFFTQEEVDVEN